MNEELHDEFYGEEWDEPIGSCEDCGVNLYRDDDSHLCDQCLWAATNYGG